MRSESGFAWVEGPMTPSTCFGAEDVNPTQANRWLEWGTRLTIHRSVMRAQI
jgi:hypothetical protein